MRLIAKRKFILIFILALAAFLRFWNLGSVPPSASMDEASIGYNAYSVLQTGRDEYGKFPFISQRGYDDWRRSTYLFLVVPFVGLFGLNAVAVRLPAVILSILTIWATYFLVKELFPKAKQFSIFPANCGIPLRRDHFQFSIGEIAAFLLAISPWHIYISRLGHESNAYLSFFIFGVLFFLQSLENKSKMRILLSMIFFTLSLSSYYSGQAFIPLFILGLVIIFRKRLFSMIVADKKITILLFAFLLLLIPLFKEMFSTSLIRFQGTSIFNPGATWQESQRREDLYKKALLKNDLLSKIVYSEKIYKIQLLAKGYFLHFNIKWLFANSGNEPFKIPGLGLLYIWELPLAVIGIVYLIFLKENATSKQLLMLWFFTAPFPAALATGAPHAMRAYTFLPTLQIFSALGFIYLYFLFRAIRLQKILVVFAITIVSLSMVNFIKQYFVVFPKEQSSSFQYAMSKAIPFVLTSEERYNKIIFSNTNNLYQSYMFFLFYSKYDPRLYLKEGGTFSGGFAVTHKFGKFEFRPIEWLKERPTSSSLYIGNPSEFPKTQTILKTFNNLNGEEAIKVIGK